MRIVLIGGGHSHVEVLRRFAAAPVAGAELVLVLSLIHISEPTRPY